MKAPFEISESNRKQIPAVVALSALLVLAVGYSVSRSLGHSPKATPRVASERSSTKATASEGTTARAAAQPSEEGLVSGLPASYMFVGNPPRDPFSPGVRPDDPAGTKPGAPRVRAGGSVQNKINRLRDMQASNLRVPPMPLGPLPGGIQVQGPGAQAGAEAPPEPKLAVTGIVRGSYDMAILRGEGGGRYFVREGQSVGEGFVVKSIAPNMVVLKSNDRRVILQLGGSHEAGSKARIGKVGN